MECEVCKALNSQGETFVIETDFWKVILSYNQYYLGRCVVLCKRHCNSLSELMSDEVLDFFSLVKKFEGALKKSLGATMFNWCCLMNDAYKTNGNSHVHWHVRPRYKKKVIIGGEEFIDENFAHHYDRLKDKRINEDTRQKIVQKIRENFN